MNKMEKRQVTGIMDIGMEAGDLTRRGIRTSLFEQGVMGAGSGADM